MYLVRNPVQLTKIQGANWNFWSSPKPGTENSQQMIFEKDLKANGRWQSRYCTSDEPMVIEGLNYKLEN